MPSKNFKVKNGIEAGSTIFGSASTTSAATLNIPHGTAPSSPTNGDFWTTTSGAYVRINGNTVGPLASSAGSGTTWGAITGTLSSQTDLQSALDAKLNLSGGTLTGNLTVSKASPVVDLTGSGTGYIRVNSTDNHAALYLDTQPNLGGSRIWFRAGGNARWMIQKNFATESGSNVGSDLEINAYNDAGSLIFTPLTITRSTGAVNISSVLNLSSSQHTIKNGTPTTLNFAKGSQFGYSSGYRVVVLGDTGTANNTSIALGYDPVANASGSFTGDGREVLFRNSAQFMTPNSANTSFIKPLIWDSSGNSTVLGLTGTDSTESTSTVSGAFKTAGGLGVAKSLNVGTGITTSGNASNWSLVLNNSSSDGGTNPWYVAATGAAWAASDNKLVFVPAADSSQSMLTMVASNYYTGIGRGNTAPASTLGVRAYTATDIGLIVKGATAQTANLTEWQNSAATVVASMSPSGAFTAVTKSFDIEHPTQENMRLRYGSLEGPENGVYIRGKSSSRIVPLPDYWTELINEDTITVQLTSKGKYQNLYVEDIVDNCVYVGGIDKEYFYFIQAERQDVDKLVVEYGS